MHDGFMQLCKNLPNFKTAERKMHLLVQSCIDSVFSVVCIYYFTLEFPILY